MENWRITLSLNSGIKIFRLFSMCIGHVLQFCKWTRSTIFVLKRGGGGGETNFKILSYLVVKGTLSTFSLLLFLNQPSDVNSMISNSIVNIIFNTNQKSVVQKLCKARQVKQFFESANCFASNYRTQTHHWRLSSLDKSWMANLFRFTLTISSSSKITYRVSIKVVRPP